jgi:hypothetical protein
VASGPSLQDFPSINQITISIMSGGMEDSSRTYDADGNRTDNIDQPRNISQSVQAEIAARRQLANQNAVPPAAANANENQAQFPGEAAPNNNIPSPSPTGVNTFFSGSRSPEARTTGGNISVAPGFIPPGFEPVANHQPVAPSVNNVPPAAAQPSPMDFASIMAQVTQQLSTSLQTMQQQIKRDNEEAIKRQFEALQGKISAEKSANPQPPIDSVHITANSSSKSPMPLPPRLMLMMKLLIVVLRTQAPHPIPPKPNKNLSPLSEAFLLPWHHLSLLAPKAHLCRKRLLFVSRQSLMLEISSMHARKMTTQTFVLLPSAVPSFLHSN